MWPESGRFSVRQRQFILKASARGARADEYARLSSRHDAPRDAHIAQTLCLHDRDKALADCLELCWLPLHLNARAAGDHKFEFLGPYRDDQLARLHAQHAAMVIGPGPSRM